jgi:hypothetical protein
MLVRLLSGGEDRPAWAQEDEEAKRAAREAAAAREQQRHEATFNAARLLRRCCAARLSPRTNRTRRVLHPVLIGHAASFTP